MSVFERLSPLIPRLSASSKQAKDHPHLPHPSPAPLSAPVIRKGIGMPSFRLQGVTYERNQKEDSGADSFGPASSSTCPPWGKHGQQMQRNNGEINVKRPAKPSVSFSPMTNTSPSGLQLKSSLSLQPRPSHPGVPFTLLDQREPQARRDGLDQKAVLDFSDRAQYLHPGYEKIHSEKQADGRMTPEKSVARVEDWRTSWRRDTKMTSSNTSINIESTEKQRFCSKLWTDDEVDQEHSRQSRECPRAARAPRWTYRGTQFKTCLVHPVQTSPVRQNGISSPHVSEMSDFLKGSYRHQASTKLRRHSNLDGELFSRPCAPESSKRTRLPGREAEDPYYVSIYYPDSVYEGEYRTVERGLKAVAGCWGGVIRLKMLLLISGGADMLIKENTG
ncbi:uncharacterized protein LOC144021349 [Festucalex cinctus]